MLKYLFPFSLHYVDGKRDLFRFIVEEEYHRPFLYNIGLEGGAVVALKP
jgi:hypothetical protein